MTTFDDDERSVEDSLAIELFAIDVGSTIYRYTSHERDYSFGGHTYTAQVIDRESIAIAPAPQPPELVFKLLASTAFAQQHLSAIPDDTTLTVTRVQLLSGAGVQWWAGDVTALTASGKWVTVRSPSTMDDPLNTEIPSFRCQRSCNYRLGDDQCQVDLTPFTLATTIDSVTDDRKLFLTTDDGNPAGWFRNGVLKRVSDGVERMIIKHLNTFITIDCPFPTPITPGTSVLVIAGCDQSVDGGQGCKQKFDNVVNFGGHPHIPSLNPWRTGLRTNFWGS